MLFQQDYDGILSIRKALPYKHYTDTKSVDFNVSKGLDRYITKISLSGSYDLSTSKLMENSIPLDYQRNTFDLNVMLNGNLSTILSYDYTMRYSTTKPKLKGGESPTTYRSISTLGQDAQVSVYMLKNLTLTTSVNYNKSYAVNSYPSTLFLDANLKYKLNRWDRSIPIAMLNLYYSKESLFGQF